MADNYLERRMADYREGRIAPTSQARRAVESTHAKSLPTILIIGGNTPEAIQSIAHFRALGWRVAFTDPDLRRGRETAQKYGAQHHPIDPSEPDALLRSIDLITTRWAHLDLILNHTPLAISLPSIPTLLINAK